MTDRVPTDEIETSVLTDTDRLRTMRHDCEVRIVGPEGYGEFWDVSRISETEVEIVIYRVNPSGYRAQIGSTEVFEIDPDTTAEEWGREAQEVDQQLAIEKAREHYADDQD